jgi:hypothetical protein
MQCDGSMNSVSYIKNRLDNLDDCILGLLSHHGMHSPLSGLSPFQHRHFASCSIHFAIPLCRVAFHNFTELPLTTFLPSVLVFLNLFSALTVPHSQQATPRGSYDPQSALQMYDAPDAIGVS